MCSLLDQTVSSVEYEILIVDNGSTDHTSEMLKKYTDNGHVRSVYEPVAGLSQARNTGWQNSRGDLVGYIDDDATVDRNWVESVFWVVDNIVPTPEWIGGPIYLDWESTRPAWLQGELQVPLGFLYWGDQPRKLSERERLGGGNSVYLKSKLADLGGFDVRLGRGASGLLSGEETQLQKRLENAGGSLFYHPGMSINHFVGRERVRPMWFYRRYFWGGVSDVIMARTFSSASAAVVSQDGSNRVVERKSRLARVFAGCLAAIGIGSDDKVVIGRIYLCYALGLFYGHIYWQCSVKNK